MFRLISKYFLFLVIVLTAAGCEKSKYTDAMEYIREIEPNEASYEAFEITEGNVYAAEIAKVKKNISDTDIYKTWQPSGTLITFEIESNADKFMPYIAYSNNSGNTFFAVFDPSKKQRINFITSADGWQYFEFGDRRNLAEGKKFGGFKYWFRFISSHICDSINYEKIEQNSIVTRTFSGNNGHIDISELLVSENGYYQIDIDSHDLASDKYSFVINCQSREITSGNDHEDYYSNKIDPLIYARFESNLTHLLVTGKLLTDLTENSEETFEISFKKQPENEELEPNDTFNYANILNSDHISGELAKEKKQILGELKEDEDWFRFEVEKGDILNIKVTPENSYPFTAEIWANSYNFTGSGLIPLRAGRLSGIETNNINMIAPFNGSLYLDLSGTDLRYNLEITKEKIEEALEFESPEKEIELHECGWKFYRWNMKPESNFAEITLKSPGNSAGLYVFDRDFLPYAFPEPLETTKFFVRKYERTDSLLLAFYLGNCDVNSEEKLILSISESLSETEKTEYNVENAVQKVMLNTSFTGFFNTDNNLYENNFEFTASEDGTVYIMTSPYRQATDFDIDTVVSLTHGNKILAQSDDMISVIHFNKYSFISQSVKAGETYTFKVTPFMSESSNIEAMNIIGFYTIDLIFRQ